MAGIGRIVDLSRRVDEQTQVYPGDPAVRLEPAATLDEDGVNVTALHLGSHSGTHVDAPWHFIEGGARVDELDLALFLGPAAILDLRGKAPREPITEEDLAPYAESLKPGVIAVLRTGWDAHHGTPRYLDHPYLASAARLLLDHGVRTVAVDALNVDETPADGSPSGDFPVHRLILGAGGVIAENLTNLGAVDFPDPVISLAPVKLGAADGAPARALAFEPRP